MDWPGLLVVLLLILLVALAVFWLAVMGALLFNTDIGGAPQLNEMRTEAFSRHLPFGKPEVSGKSSPVMNKRGLYRTR